MRKLTIQECQQKAVEKGGKCLSETYTNSKTKMQWQCSEGHIWYAVFGNIKYLDNWCPECNGSKPHTIDICKDMAESRGGKCLTTEYKNVKTPMKWMCSEGHTWSVSFDGIKNNDTWCPSCTRCKPFTITECKDVAESKEGKCLSEKYVNANTHIEWMCSREHTWLATFDKVKNGKRWCPICAKGRSERLSREIIEEYMGLPFPSSRPSFLQGLELDGYNSDLDLAFEYQGKQHYEYSPFFHKGDITLFEAQQERDERKYRICDEKGITLIYIPYTFSYMEEDKLREYIYQELVDTDYIVE